jgi:hypothetical protein
MTSDTSTVAKECCACGVSVSGQARMKDSHGKYWCVPCGQADQRRKQVSATHANCASCRKPFPKGKLDKDGEWFFCKPCLKKRTKVTKHAPAVSAAASSGGGAAIATMPSEKRKTFALAAVLLLLVVLSILFNFVFME